MFYPLGTGYAQDLARRQNIGVHAGTVIGMLHIMAGFSGLIAGALATVGGFSLGGVMGVGSLAMSFCILMTKSPKVGVNHAMDVAEATL